MRITRVLSPLPLQQSSSAQRNQCNAPYSADKDLPGARWGAHIRLVELNLERGSRASPAAVGDHVFSTEREGEEKNIER